MKNINNKIVAGLAATAVLALSFGTASAMWNWGGQGGLGKMITAEEKAKLQSMSEDDRQEYANELKAKYNVTTSGEGRWEGKGEWKGNHGEWKKGGKEAKEWHSTWDMLNDIEKQDVDAIEIDLLEKQYEEEMMANELYNSFYEMYGIETFKNIANSEAQHMEAVKSLLDRYDIEVPTNYDHIQDLYDSLKEAWSKSAFDALEVWVKIEFVDIDDIIKAIKATDNDDIKVVLTNIWGASYNHLRGFLKAIDSNGYETELDWNQYLDESDLSVKWPIKYKLAEKLEADGVDLPEQVSSENMKKKKCDDKDGKHWDNDSEHWNKDDKHWDNDKEHSKKMNDANHEKVKAYKNAINKKYWKAISAMSDDKLESISVKIDDLLAKTTNEKTRLVLVALQEIIDDNLADVDLDWLLQ